MSRPFGFYKIKPAKYGRFLAWGGLTLLSTDSPASEPSAPVYFCFGKTEQDAAQALHKEMDKEIMPLRWWRQPLL